MVHLRLSWLQLSSDRNDLKAALEETQMLRVTDMSTALLTVFVDSARNLPHARQNANPDAYLTLSVGKKTEQTSVQMRSDSPVWEQGFTFLVANPENDTLQVKIMDQKTTNQIGTYTFIIAHLMDKKNMEVVSQPYQLQKSGPDSRVTMALALRILKRGVRIEHEEAEKLDEDVKDELPKVPLRKQDSKIARTSVNEAISSDPSNVEDPMTAAIVSSNLAAAPPSPTASLKSDLGRCPSIKSLGVEAGPLGAINMTIQYSMQRQRLIIIIHKIKNIPLKDPSNIPDPYVKLYLLPGRSKDSKRKTAVIKDNCNPVFDATFEYLISIAELNTTQLEVTICTDKFLGSPILGMLKIDLNDPEIQGSGKNFWSDLKPEFKSTDL
jgi:hypothetical protein